MLPDMDGFTVTRRLREQGRQLPIVFVTARDSVDDKIKGLTVGGDDYVTKPFSLEEVVARIRAVLRRTRGEADEDRQVLTFEDLELDEDSHEVRRAGRVIETSPTEFKLLRYLMLNPNRVLSKAQILDHVWDYDFRGEAGIVESYISYLRRKIDAEGLPAADPHQARRRLRAAPAAPGLMTSTPTPRADRGPVARVVRRLEAVPLRTRLVAIVGTARRRGADPHQPRDGLPDAVRPHGRGRRRAALGRPAGRQPGPGRPQQQRTRPSRPTTPSSCRPDRRRHPPARPGSRRRRTCPTCRRPHRWSPAASRSRSRRESRPAQVALHRRAGHRRRRDVRGRHPAEHREPHGDAGCS